MRWLRAGLLVLFIPTAAWAQARGQVLSIGFNNHYRPDCWTPMLVQLTSQSEDSVDYMIQVVQEDLDRDKVSYTQMVTLGGNAEGKPATTENFWVYFKPRSTGGGLPDATDVSSNLNTLNHELKVFLCNKNGKQITTLPITSTILSADPHREMMETTRGRKLILLVTDGTDRPIIPDYGPMKGVLEDVEPVVLQPRDLPSDVRGYEAVDAIVWMNADANFLTSGTRAPSLEAIGQWVRQGGNLAVCQPSESFKIGPFKEILPVGGLLNGEWTIPMADRPGIDVLQRVIEGDDSARRLGSHKLPEMTGTFKVARVPALKDAKVDEWMEWNDNGVKSYTPWLARRGVGLGAVTWVAQDLGNPALTDKIRTGWRFVWDRVLGWNNADVPEDYQSGQNENEWSAPPGAVIDLGKPLIEFNMTKDAFALVMVAGGFLVIYLVIAALGLPLFLWSRKMAQLNWFYFAGSAMVATVLTMLLVKLVVRGPPKLRHNSFVRYAVGEPTGVVDSRLSLYVRQDGDEQIDLPNTSPHEVSDIAPFSMYPDFVKNDDILPAYLEYEIPVHESSDADSVSVTIPFRSTSKKLQLHWVGPIKDTILVPAGTPPLKLDTFSNGYIQGTLVNHTGVDLSDVYFLFKAPAGQVSDTTSVNENDVVLYVPSWPKDGVLKPQDLMVKTNFFVNPGNNFALGGKVPAFAYSSTSGVGWQRFWQMNAKSSQDLQYEEPLLTAFSRMVPWRHSTEFDRDEFVNHEVRMMDLSPAINAGRLVICAIAGDKDHTEQSPLPITLNVSGSPVTGDGITLMQFVLPLNRSDMYHVPSTQASAGENK